MDPYYSLACAVVEQAISELHSSEASLRKRACKDIREGGLDFWVRQVAGDQEMLDRINAKLAEIVAAA